MRRRISLNWSCSLTIRSLIGQMQSLFKPRLPILLGSAYPLSTHTWSTAWAGLPISKTGLQTRSYSGRLAMTRLPSLSWLCLSNKRCYPWTLMCSWLPRCSHSSFWESSYHQRSEPSSEWCPKRRQEWGRAWRWWAWGTLPTGWAGSPTTQSSTSSLQCRHRLVGAWKVAWLIQTWAVWVLGGAWGIHLDKIQGRGRDRHSRWHYQCPHGKLFKVSKLSETVMNLQFRVFPHST